MSKIRIKPGISPTTGAPYVTRHPSTMVAIPREGALVPDDVFTRRRIAEGSWIPVATAPAQPAPVAATTDATSASDEAPAPSRARR